MTWRRVRRRRHLLVEVDFHKLPEATAVVVPHSFRVSESLQQRIGCGRRRRTHEATEGNGGDAQGADGSHLPLFSHRYPALFRTRSSGTCGEANTVRPEPGHAADLTSAEQSHPHLRTNLVFSVLPAPDSPETMMDWLIFRTFMSLYALSAGRATQTQPVRSNLSPTPL